MNSYQHSSPKSALNGLMDSCGRAARDQMEKYGGLVTCFTALTDSGLIGLPGLNLDGEAAKDEFAFTIRLACIATPPKAAVLAMEVWMAIRPLGDSTELVRGSLCPDRREGIFLAGEAQGGIYAQRFLPILRDASGRFTGFDPAECFPPEPMGGRYSRLLPQHAPSKEQQRAAEATLRAFGFNFHPVSGAGGSPLN